MRVVLNLSTYKLLQQMVNIHVMHSSSQLDTHVGGRRITGALYRLLECALYLFFCFRAYRDVTRQHSEAAGAVSKQLSRTLPSTLSQLQQSLADLLVIMNG